MGWGSSKGDGSSSGRLCLARRSRDGMQPYTLMCVVGGGDGGGGGGGTSSDKLRHVFHFYTTILLYIRFLENAMSSYSRLERVPSGCPECLVDHAGVEDAVGRPKLRNSFSGHAPVVNTQASLELVPGQEAKIKANQGSRIKNRGARIESIIRDHQRSDCHPPPGDIVGAGVWEVGPRWSAWLGIASLLHRYR